MRTQFTAAVNLKRYAVFYIPRRKDCIDVFERVPLTLEDKDLRPDTIIPADAVSYEVYQQWEVETPEDVPSLNSAPTMILTTTFIDAARINHLKELPRKDNGLENYKDIIARGRALVKRRDGQIIVCDRSDRFWIYNTNTRSRKRIRLGKPIRTT